MRDLHPEARLCGGSETAEEKPSLCGVKAAKEKGAASFPVAPCEGCFSDAVRKRGQAPYILYAVEVRELLLPGASPRFRTASHPKAAQKFSIRVPCEGNFWSMSFSSKSFGNGWSSCLRNLRYFFTASAYFALVRTVRGNMAGLASSLLRHRPILSCSTFGRGPDRCRRRACWRRRRSSCVWGSGGLFRLGVHPPVLEIHDAGGSW